MKSLSGRHIIFYVKNYKLNSMFVKNLVVFTMLVILPISGIGTIFFYNANSLMNNEINTLNINILGRIQDVTEMLARDMQMITVNISLQDSTQVLVRSPIKSNIYGDITSRIKSLLNMYSLVNTCIDSIYVYTEKNKFVIGNNESNVLEKFSDTNWIDLYKKANQDSILIVSRGRNGKYPYYITFIKKIEDKTVGESLGGVIINVNVKAFEKTLVDKVESGRKLYIFNTQGDVIYSNDYSLMGNNISKEPEIFKLTDQQTGILNKNDVQYTTCSIKSNDFNWMYVSLLPTEKYSEKINSLMGFIFGILVVFILLGIIISYYLSLRTFEPISNLFSLFNWQGQNFDIYKNKDEINFIRENIINTMQTNKQMQDELEYRLNMLKQAQAAALQAQINPHFLYNTLENISWLAVKLSNRENDVSKSLVTLSRLLRIGMQSNSFIVQLNEELYHANLYVNLLKLRYNGIFDVKWEVDSQVVEYKIVKLSLQPVIENAVYHGIKTKGENGIINIRCSVDDVLKVEVSDNGIGMPQDRLIELSNSLKCDYDTLDINHIGLRNVNQRIKLIFGPEYGIDITSEFGVGTTVIIKLPAIK